jgi:hypothetical protein
MCGLLFEGFEPPDGDAASIGDLGANGGDAGHRNGAAASRTKGLGPGSLVMVDRPPTRHETPDELPHFAASDHLLSMRRHTHGPGGVVGKIALAALALLVLFAITAGIWAAVEASHRDDISAPNVQLEQR